MKVYTSVNDQVLTVTVDGEINTLTTPILSKEVEDLSGIRKLIFELEKVPYVSSAGLRLFLSCQRTMNATHGDMRILNCNEFLTEIFVSVGYDRIMKLERTNQANETGSGAEQ